MLPEAAAGADQTLELLYRDHAQDVSRYALAVLGDRADAEDVTQTTFLNAYRALQRGERPMKPENWLIAIAHNACRERFRNGQRRPREVVFLDEVSAAARSASTTVRRPTSCGARCSSFPRASARRS